MLDDNLPIFYNECTLWTEGEAELIFLFVCPWLLVWFVCSVCGQFDQFCKLFWQMTFEIQELQ